MITIRSARSGDRPTGATSAPARPTEGLPLWLSDGVLWGVVRMEGCFDVGDTARHAGIVQHAFPLGRDWLAACGFRTPLQKAFDGVRRPLLAMPGVHNPRCGSCEALIVPAVAPAPAVEGSAADASGWILRRLDPTPTSHDPRPARPAVAIPIDGRPAEAAWPAEDRAPVHEEDRLRVLDAWRRVAHDIPQDTEPEVMETAGPVGRRAFMEVDRAERIWR